MGSIPGVKCPEQCTCSAIDSVFSCHDLYNKPCVLVKWVSTTGNTDSLYNVELKITTLKVLSFHLSIYYPYNDPNVISLPESISVHPTVRRMNNIWISLPLDERWLFDFHNFFVNLAFKYLSLLQVWFSSVLEVFALVCLHTSWYASTILLWSCSNMG